LAAGATGISTDNSVCSFTSIATCGRHGKQLLPVAKLRGATSGFDQFEFQAFEQLLSAVEIQHKKGNNRVPGENVRQLC
jgi:hypothetical protein